MSISGEGGRPPFGPGAHAQQRNREDRSGQDPANRSAIDRLSERSSPGESAFGTADQSQEGLADAPFGAPAAGGPLPGLAAFGRMAGIAPTPPSPHHPPQRPQEFEPRFEPVRPGPRVLTRDTADDGAQNHHQPSYRHGHGHDRDADDGYRSSPKDADFGEGFEAENATDFGQPGDTDDFASGLPEELRRYLDANTLDEDGEEDEPGGRDGRAPGEEEFDVGEHGPGVVPAFAGYETSLGEGEEANSARAFDGLDRALDEQEAEDASAGAEAFEPLELSREHLVADASGDYATFVDERDEGWGADARDSHDDGQGDDGLHDDLHDDGRMDITEGAHEADLAGRGLRAFEARYDQHPEIPIGAFPGGGDEQPFEQPMFPEGEADAAFMDGDDPSAPGDAHPPSRGRKVLMVGCGLVGALALGGALAFAYKTGGDSVAGSGQPPIIQADAEPVKTAPANPGGREFPDRNKEIYERLQGEERAQEERLVPRQEEAAAPRHLQTGAINGESRPATDQPGAVPAADTQQAAPRRVRTFVVRPDGSVVQPSEAESPPPAQTAERDQVAAPGMSVVMRGDQQPGAAPRPSQERPLQQQSLLQQQQQAGSSGAAAIRPEPTQPQPTQEPRAQQPEQRAQQQQSEERAQPERRVAAVPPAETSSVLLPTRRPDPPPGTAARQPASATSGGSSGYVVQVAAHRSQTDALAAFADLQQRYPNQLRNYRPIIERADLRERGVFYRLRVGPMETRQMAGNLCEQLKSAGLQSCLVYSQ